MAMFAPAESLPGPATLTVFVITTSQKGHRSINPYLVDIIYYYYRFLLISTATNTTTSTNCQYLQTSDMHLLTDSRSELRQMAWEGLQRLQATL